MTYFLWMIMGFVLFSLFYRFKMGGFQSIATKLIHQAELECEAKKSALALMLKEMEHAHQEKCQKQNQEIKNKQIKLDKQLKEAHHHALELEKRFKDIEKKEFEIERLREKNQSLGDALVLKLQHVAQLDSMQAQQLLLEKLEKETGAYLLKAKKRLEEEVEQEALRLLTATLPRLASNFALEATTTTLSLPSNEMKGRIIGREGRNIRLLEQLTGVNFLLDESPGAVVLSSCDPIRREIAKVALQHLLRDGRIHASRIEEVVEKAQKELDKLIYQHGEKAAHQVSINDLHPELIRLLGRLHFLHSHGQNLLEHSLEVATLMGMMASELKLNSDLAKRMGLLHDIGKAASSTYEGSHAQVGAMLAMRYEETQEVANGIEAHHQETPPQTLEALLLLPADTLSASRPGARCEAIDHYIKRMKKMEQICTSFEDVEKAYALQAGREVCVLVKPEKVNDEAAQSLARQLVRQLEKELSFTGKIKVTVVREKKVIDYAT